MSIVPYTEIGFESKEEAKEFSDYLNDDYKDIEGLDYALVFADTEATETITIDYMTIDFDEVTDLVEIETDDDGKPAGFISLERTIELLEAEGYAKVE